MLQCASARGAADVAAYALSVNSRAASSVDCDGNAALALAAKGGHDSVVTLLFDAEADVNAINKVSEEGTKTEKNLNAQAFAYEHYLVRTLIKLEELPATPTYGVWYKYHFPTQKLFFPLVVILIDWLYR